MSAGDTGALAPGPGETLDSIGSRVRVLQRIDGYRFNLDAILLAGFAVEELDPARPLRAVDLGTGTGIVALLIAHWRPAWRVRAIEVQPSLAGLARRNVALNGAAIELVEADWRSVGTPGVAGDAELVVCNPPYYAPDAGVPCADEEKGAARQELHGGLDEAARAAARLARGNGSVRFIHLASRLADLTRAFEDAGLGLTRLRFVHPRAGEPAHTVLAEARPGSRRPLVVSPPLIVHVDGGYAPEVQALLGGAG